MDQPCFAWNGSGPNGSTDFFSTYPILKASTLGSPVHSTTIDICEGSSTYFDGSSCVKFPDNPLWQLESNFTVRAKIYPTALPTTESSGNLYPYRGNVVGQSPPGSSAGWDISVGMTKLVFNITDSNIITATHGFVINPTQPYDVEVSRFGNNFYMFIDGVLVGTGSSGATVDDISAELTIGAEASGVDAAFFTGYIGGVEIWTKCLHTSAFTPPTIPFFTTPVIPDVLLHFDGAQGSTTIVNDGSSSATFTALGAAALSTYRYKDGQSSFLITDGSGLAYSNSSVFNAGIGDFTFRVLAHPIDLARAYSNIFDTVPPGTSTTDPARFAAGFDNTGRCYIYHNGSFFYSTAVCKVKQFNDFVLQRRSGQVEIYLNGISVLSITSTDDINLSGFILGNITNYASDSSLSFYGNLEKFEAYIGTALYSASFTPTNLIKIPDLQIKMNGASGSTTFIDDGYHSVDITSFPTATQNGDGSASFSAGGYLRVIDNRPTNIPFGKDFCLYGYFTCSSTQSFTALFTKNNGSFTADSYGLFLNAGSPDGKIVIYSADFSGGSPLMTSSSGGYNDGLRHFFAWTRYGGVHQLWIDGLLVATNSSAFNFSTSGNYLIIAQDLNFSPRAFTGSMNEIGFIYGDAVYTETFTPPDPDPSPSVDVEAEIDSSNSQSSLMVAVQTFLSTMDSLVGQSTSAIGTLTYMSTASSGQGSQSQNLTAVYSFLSSMSSSQGQSSDLSSAISFSSTVSSSQGQSTSITVVPLMLASMESSQGSQSQNMKGTLFYLDIKNLSPMLKDRTVIYSDYKDTRWIAEPRKSEIYLQEGLARAMNG